MNGDAEVIVLACWSDEVMDPLTRGDPERTWQGRFVPIAGHWGYAFGWALELEKMRVLLHDQDDDCFGLWMLQEGRLVEVTLPRTGRFHQVDDERNIDRDRRLAKPAITAILEAARQPSVLAFDMRTEGCAEGLPHSKESE